MTRRSPMDRIHDFFGTRPEGADPADPKHTSTVLVALAIALLIIAVLTLALN
jgi:hypothetical protein